MQLKLMEDIQRFPSDITLDYHPRQQGSYYFDKEDAETLASGDDREKENGDDEEEDGTCVSSWFKQVRSNTLRLIRDPGQLSDVRLLALNDIYCISPTTEACITKYATRKACSNYLHYHYA